MILDYNRSKRLFYIRVPRKDTTTVQELMREHGFDFSASASNRGEAVLLTPEPYAAVAFFDQASADARGELEALHAEIVSSWKPTSDAHILMPPDRELWGFQKADVEYILRKGNALDADEPGLGKTPTAICVANEMRATRVLVICPASIRLQWVKRIREWTTMKWPLVIHPILNSRNGVHPNANWTIVSYDLARTESIGSELARGTYDLLILDEGHYLKTIDSRRTRAVFGGGHPLFEHFAGRSGAILGLTGTPIPNRPREAYTMARGLCWDAIDWMSEDAFRKRFNPSMQRQVVNADGEVRLYNDERAGRHSELQSRMRANFMVRHLKREVMPQLKLPIYDLIYVEDTGPVKAALQAESLLDIDPDNLEGARAEVLGHIAVVRRLMGIALAPQVATYIDMLIAGGEEKLVLFGWHIEVLNILERALHKHGLVRIDGSTGTMEKERRVNQFVTDPRCQICLGNIQSMGVGTDGLQAVAYHGLIAEPSWTPGDNVQAFDRLDRGGQTRTVQGDIFVARNSFAERILAAALRKLATTFKALDRRM